MGKVAKKAAPKKGKSSDKFFKATHHYNMEPIGPARHDVYLRWHDFGMVGSHPSLLKHGAEGQMSCWNLSSTKSLVLSKVLNQWARI